MIIKNGKTIASIYKGNQVTDKIMKGTLVVYEAFKNLLASGVLPLTLTNCKGANLVDYKVYGESVQKLRVGKNLFNIEQYSSYIDISKYEIGDNLVISTKDQYLFKIASSAGASSSTQVTGKYMAFTMTQEYKNLKKLFIISTKTYDYETKDNLLDQNVQLEYGTEPTEYEPYVGTIPPTPEAPIEVESVGERTKNLVKIPDIDSTTTTGTINCYLTKRVLISCQEYPSSIKNNNGVETSIWRISFNYLDGTTTYIVDDGLRKIGNYVNTFKASEENPIISITYRNIYIVEGAYKNIQIEYGEDGTNPTDYEPYGYKIPVTSSGKNLFNTRKVGAIQGIDAYTIIDDNAFSINTGEGSLPARYIMWYFPHKLKRNTNYTFSCILNSNGDANNISHNRVYIRGRDLNGAWGYIHYGSSNTGNQTDKLYKFTFNTNDCEEIQIAFYAVVSNGEELKNYTATLSNIQVELGATKTDFETYKDPTTTNIYLNEPLRKIGDYADYVDFENSKVIRNIGQIIYNGSEDWKGYSSGNGYAIGNTDFIDEHKVMSNLLENSQILVKTLAIRKNYKNIYVFGLNTDYPTVDDWKAFLTTTPLKVIGALSTPTEETIQLPNIPTFKGTTILSIDTNIQPSNVEVVYKGK